MKRFKLVPTLLLAVTANFAAYAEQVLVLSAAAVKTSVSQVPALYAEIGEDRVHFQFGTAGSMRDKAIQGESFDLIIVPPPAMAELEARNLVDGSSKQPLGTVRLGCAIAKGKVPIALTDVDSLKRVLIQARSIGIADPSKGATTGIYLSKLFATLGLVEEMKSKLKVYPEGQNAMEAVASQEVEIAIGQFSEASSVIGLEPLVALPEAVQLKTTYVAAISKNSPNQSRAKNLMNLLISPQVQKTFSANGFVVGENPQ